MSEDGEVIEVQDVGALRVLRLNRPERKNALNRDLLDSLFTRLREAARDDSVRAVALTGNGNAFCSGLDVADPAMLGGAQQAAGTEAAPATPAITHPSVLMRIECEKPIVAGINGSAVGAGVSLALNADIRIAAPSARFHPGYTRIGVSPDFGMTWTLLRAVGYERAMRFILEQRMVPAPEAIAIGLVSECVERDEDLDTRLIEYGTMLAQVAPLAAQQTKRLLVRADQPTDLVGQLDTEIELVMRAIRSEDSAEAIRALATGEKPNFRGR